ncbi:MAG: hypothetical protein QOE61_5494 [Micromonosporaceae bacterium]|nr:hypothetical protein [Micromonosporaceae bacterium]
MPGVALDGCRLVDGGVWANNPAMVALIEATGPLGVPFADIRMFSLGTTTDVPHCSRRLDRGGLMAWARDAVEVLMRAQSISANNQVSHLITPDRLLRLNPTVPTGAVALDKVKADDLIGRAAHDSRAASPRFDRCFTDHQAPAYTPYHSTRKE